MSVPVTIIGVDEPDAIGSVEPPTGTNEQPRKVESNLRQIGLPVIDPFTIRDAGSDPTDRPSGSGNDSPKRRGRPPGSKNRTTGTEEKAVPSDLNKLDIASLLVSTHFMASKYFEAPEWELPEAEAKDGAEYLQKLSKHYNHNINPVALLWVGFIFWIITTYGTRCFATYARVTEANPTKKKGPELVPPKPQPNAPPAQKRDLSQMAPSELWNEPPIDS